MPDLPALVSKSDCVLLKVRAAPGSSRDGLSGLHGDALKVTVTAVAEKGRANRAVCRVVSRALGLRGSQVSLHSGQASRDKWLRLEGAKAREIREVLAALLAR